MQDEPTIITIPPGGSVLPDVGQLKVGDSLDLNVKINAIDDSGVSVEVVSAEKGEPDTPAGESGDAMPAMPTDNPQADYVSGRRKQKMGQMMSGTE